MRRVTVGVGHLEPRWWLVLLTGDLLTCDLVISHQGRLFISRRLTCLRKHYTCVQKTNRKHRSCNEYDLWTSLENINCAVTDPISGSYPDRCWRALINQVYQGSQMVRYVGTRFKEGGGCSGWLRVPICSEYKIKWKGPLLGTERKEAVWGPGLLGVFPAIV